MNDIPRWMSEKELREAMDEWNYEQDHANANLPGSVLPVPKDSKRRSLFCPPTFVAKVAEALEAKEK